MAQVLVRDLTDDTVEAIKNLARRHHRSLNQEVRSILEAAANRPDTDPSVLAEQIRRTLEGRGVLFSDSGLLQAEDRCR